MKKKFIISMVAALSICGFLYFWLKSWTDNKSIAVKTTVVETGGLILGIIGAHALGVVAGVSPTISPLLVIGTLVFSSFVGLFFDIYPAKRRQN